MRISLFQKLNFSQNSLSHKHKSNYDYLNYRNKDDFMAMRQTQKQIKENKKHILVRNLETGEIKLFKNQKEAADELKIAPSDISYATRSKNKSTHGWVVEKFDTTKRIANEEDYEKSEKSASRTENTGKEKRVKKEITPSTIDPMTSEEFLKSAKFPKRIVIMTSKGAVKVCKNINEACEFTGLSFRTFKKYFESGEVINGFCFVQKDNLDAEKYKKITEKLKEYDRESFEKYKKEYEVQLNKNRRHVIAYNFLNNEISLHQSGHAAARELNLLPEAINKTINEKYMQTGGYIFRYIDTTKRIATQEDYEKSEKFQARMESMSKDYSMKHKRRTKNYQIAIKNNQTGEINFFNTEYEAAAFLSYSQSYINSIINKKISPPKDYAVYLVDISEKSDDN